MALPARGFGVGGMLFGDGGGDAGGGPVHVGGGKNARQQDLMSPHSGMKSTLASGDPMSRAMGQYGKGHSFASPLSMIRGGKGNMGRIRGGLGAGQKGMPAKSGDYSLKSVDD